MSKIFKSFYSDQLDFEVTKQELFTEVNGVKLPIEKSVAIMSSANEANTCLGIVGHKYNLFENERFSALTQMIGQKLELNFDHYGVHNNGQRVMACFKKTDKQLSILGHTFSNHMIISDHRDGNGALSLGCNGVLNRCNNMFKSTNNLVKIHHNSLLEEMLKEVIDSMGNLENDQLRRILRLEKLADTVITKDQICEFVAKEYCTSAKSFLTAREVRQIADRALVMEASDDSRISGRRRNIIQGFVDSWDIESKSLGQNGFAAYNAMTYFNTHQKGLRSGVQEKGHMDLVFTNSSVKEDNMLKFLEAIN